MDTLLLRSFDTFFKESLYLVHYKLFQFAWRNYSELIGWIPTPTFPEILEKPGNFSSFVPEIEMFRYNETYIIRKRKFC